MCTGLEIAAGAALLGGTGLQMKAQSDARRERKAILRRNAESQDALVKKSEAELERARDQYGRDAFDEGQEQETNRLAEIFSGAQSYEPVGDYAPTASGDAPSAVKNFETNARAKNADFTKQYADALARMGGFGQNLTNRNTQTNRSAQQMDLNRTFMRGNDQLAQTQLSMVDASSPLGDILTAAGGIGLGYSLAAPAAGAGATAAAYGPSTASSFADFAAKWNAALAPTAKTATGLASLGAAAPAAARTISNNRNVSLPRF